MPGPGDRLDIPSLQQRLANLATASGAAFDPASPGAVVSPRLARRVLGHDQGESVSDESSGGARVAANLLPVGAVEVADEKEVEVAEKEEKEEEKEEEEEEEEEEDECSEARLPNDDECPRTGEQPVAVDEGPPEVRQRVATRKPIPAVTSYSSAATPR